MSAGFGIPEVVAAPQRRDAHGTVEQFTLARAGIKVRGMNLPPGSTNDRRHLPRHIRDGEHEMWQDAGETTAGSASRPRRWRMLAWVVLVAALVAGLWFYNAMR